jgi:hypothetical protein
MSGTTSDRTSPDHAWEGNGMTASTNDVADAVAHMKAWAAREIAALKAEVARLTKPTAPPASPAPTPVAPAPVPAPNPAPTLDLDPPASTPVSGEDDHNA